MPPPNRHETSEEFGPEELDRLISEGDRDIERGCVLDGDDALAERRSRRAKSTEYNTVGEPPFLPRGISVIVPVYNSAVTLDNLIARLGPMLEGMGVPYEAVLVNDGSRDDSWGAIERVCLAHPWVHGIDLMRNNGQENALLCGIRAARYALAATIDDDLQNPPEEIPRMIEKLEAERLDVVYGTPQREQHGLFRDLASVVTKLVLQEAMGAKNARNVTAFKVFRTQLRDAFEQYRSPHVSIDVLLTWGTQRFGALTVRHDARAVGTSNFTFRRLANHAINMITGFSVVPLQLASLVGFAFSLFGFAALVYVLVDYFFRGDPVPGFPFLAALVAIFSGAQMFALGIMGEYLARMYLRASDRRPYTVRREISMQPELPTNAHRSSRGEPAPSLALRRSTAGGDR